MSILQAKNISKSFVHKYNLKVLDGIDLDINEGDFVCLVGPSGCGKSTFLRILVGFEKPDEGSVIFNGKEVTRPGSERIMVFQEGALFPWLSVRDNVEFGLKMANIPVDERHKISKRYLDMMQLDKFVDSFTYQLSTGMKQRVAIARALAMDPAILLMDEPFASLDAFTRDLLIKEMQAIWSKTRKTIIFVTHSVIEATMLGTKIAVFSGRPSQIKRIIDVSHDYPRSAQDEKLVELQKKILAELGRKEEDKS